MARVVEFSSCGEPDVLQVVERDVRAPGPGELRIKVEAFGVQQADSMWRRGAYIQAPSSFPAGLGYDCVGTVDDLGPGVLEHAVGDKVMCIPGFSLNDYTVYGDNAVVPARHVFALPDRDLSWDAFAAIPVPYFTSYFALYELADLPRAKTVLVTAASASTALAAIQFAKWEGATVIATSRTSAKRDKILGHGADHFVATDEGSVADAIRAIAGEGGVDIVFDPIGGALLATWYEVLARRGIIIHYGLLDMADGTVPVMTSMMKAATLKSYMIFEFTGNDALGLPRNDDAVARGLRRICEGIEGGQLVPVVAQSFRLQDVAESHRFLESNAQVGKIVVRAA